LCYRTATGPFFNHKNGGGIFPLQDGGENDLFEHTYDWFLSVAEKTSQAISEWKV
jgi:hypothetical protein